MGAHLTQTAAGPIALRYAEQVSATVLRDRIFPESGWNGRAPSMPEIILAQQSPLERARSWHSRSATASYLDPQPNANRVVEALSRWRRDENVIIRIHLTINRLAAGLPNSG